MSNRLAEALRIVLDDLLEDLFAHLGARIDDELVEAQHAALPRLIEPVRRNRRRCRT